VQLDLYHSPYKSAHIPGFLEQDGGGVTNEMTNGSSMFLYHQLLYFQVSQWQLCYQLLQNTYFIICRGCYICLVLLGPTHLLKGKKILETSLGGVEDLSNNLILYLESDLLMQESVNFSGETH